MIIEQILVTGMAVFCYLVVDESTGEAILIDPAGDFDKIDARIKKHGADIKYIINTHGHYDHTSGNRRMMEKTGAPLLIHGSDLRHLGGIDVSLCAKFTGKDRNPAAVILLLQNNDSITVGQTRLWAVHTPGHSAGSICLYCDGNIFTGDTLFTEGVGRTDLPDGSHQSLIHSIKNRILTLPDETKIWPGHHYGAKPWSTVAEQKRYFGLE